MKLKHLVLSLSGVALSFMMQSAYAWKHAISLGYGWGNELNKDYSNKALTLSGKLYKFPKINEYLIATVDGTLAQLHANTPRYGNVKTASVGLGLRGYFVNPDLHKAHPYVGISSGPAYLSKKRLGEQQQGSHFTLQSTLEGGVDFALKNSRGIDINLRLLHYSNAGLVRPNRSFNVPFVISIGYQF